MSKSSTTSEAKKLFVDGKEFEYRSPKAGGANSAGVLGGVYQNDGQLALIKSDSTVKDMSEFLASKLFEQTAPDHSARVGIARERDINGKDAGSPYVCSYFLPDYADLSTKVTTRSMKKDGRVFAAGFVNKFTGFMRAKMLDSGGKPKYSGFPETMATSLLIGDFDVHTGNVGLVENKKLVRIDYAAAFDNLEPEIHPNSRSRHPVGKGPTNHFREYPRSMRISPEFAEHAFAVSKMDMGAKIDEGMKELGEHYRPEDFVSFGKRLGMDAGNLIGKPEDVQTNISKHLKTILKKRQESLKQYAIEISIDLCFDKKGNFQTIVKADGTVIQGEKHFNQLMNENPEYFAAVKKGEKKLHFRDKAHKSTFGFLDITRFTRGAIVRQAVMAKIKARAQETTSFALSRGARAALMSVSSRSVHTGAEAPRSAVKSLGKNEHFI